MANMAHCRFRNTLEDLRDCYEALGSDGVEGLEGDEREAAEKLIRLCSRISADHLEDLP